MFPTVGDVPCSFDCVVERFLLGRFGLFGEVKQEGGGGRWRYCWGRGVFGACVCCIEFYDEEIKGSGI